MGVNFDFNSSDISKAISVIKVMVRIDFGVYYYAGMIEQNYS